MEKEGREEGWGINLIRIIANDKEERDLVGNGGGARGIRLLEAHRSIRNAGGSEAEYSFSLFHLRRVRGIREPTHEHAELSR